MAEQADAAAADRLKTTFRAYEATMRASLERTRGQFDHPGIKGDAIEGAFRSFLRSHVPRRLEVGHGEVIDRFGHRSRQHDVVLLDEDQPFLAEPGTAGLYVCEGVAAAGEVKSMLGARELADVVKKGTEFRSLRVMYNKNDTISANPSDTKRYYASPPFFAFAIESSMSTQSIIKHLSETEYVSSPQPEGDTLPAVDALFVLDRGTFINYGDGQGALQFRLDDGTLATGWLFLGKEDVLVHLFLWLHAVMPRVRRWTPIGIPYLIPGSG